MSRFRIAALLAPLGLLLALGGLACGSEQSKIDRGVAVDPEVAAPDSPREDELSAAQRLEREEDEEDARSKQRFDEAQQPAD
jgi:hypothetical protein